jgi:hypothetical protein
MEGELTDYNREARAISWSVPVIALLVGMLCLLGGGSLWWWFSKAHAVFYTRKKCESNLITLTNAVQLYSKDKKALPKELADLLGGYLTILPLCPATNTSTYRIKPTMNGDFIIYCQGCNHRPLGERESQWVDRPNYNSRTGLLSDP